jgi:hypothetical protein
MSKLGIVIIVLPLVLIAVFAFMGTLQLGRSLVCGSAVFFAGLVIYAGTMPAALHDPGYAMSGFFMGFMLMSLSPWAALVLGILLSNRTARPPIVQVAETYQGLDPATQDKMLRFGRLALKVGANHLSRHLRDKGHVRTADALRDGNRII